MFTIKGTIKALMDEQTGTSKAGREWNSREFILEINDEGFVYPVHLKAFGVPATDLDKCHAGDIVTMDFRIASREYNGRWYQEINVRGVHPEHKAPEPATVEQADLPF